MLPIRTIGSGAYSFLGASTGRTGRGTVTGAVVGGTVVGGRGAGSTGRSTTSATARGGAWWATAAAMPDTSSPAMRTARTRRVVAPAARVVPAAPALNVILVRCSAPDRRP